MGKYEQLLIKHNNLFIHETTKLPNKLSGLTVDDMILINQNKSESAKYETLAEEIAHHQITYGDIRNQDNILNKKLELKARRHAYENVISLDDIINAFYFGVSNTYEMADFLEVSESYVNEVLNHYRNKYGLSVYHNKYLVKFDPLQVYKYIDKEE